MAAAMAQRARSVTGRGSVGAVAPLSGGQVSQRTVSRSPARQGGSASAITTLPGNSSKFDIRTAATVHPVGKQRRLSSPSTPSSTASPLTARRNSPGTTSGFIPRSSQLNRRDTDPAGVQGTNPRGSQSASPAPEIKRSRSRGNLLTAQASARPARRQSSKTKSASTGQHICNEVENGVVCGSAFITSHGLRTHKVRIAAVHPHLILTCVPFNRRRTMALRDVSVRISANFVIITVGTVPTMIGCSARIRSHIRRAHSRQVKTSDELARILDEGLYTGA